MHLVGVTVECGGQECRDLPGRAERGVPAGEEALRANRSGWALAVDQPLNAELINEHAETRRPKCFLQRHLYGPIFRQLFEDALSFCGIAEIELQSEPLWFLILPGQRIRAGEHEVFMSERGMADFLSPIRRRLHIHGRILVRHHEGGLATEAPFVKLEGGFAMAVECEKWIQLHAASFEPIETCGL